MLNLSLKTNIPILQFCRLLSAFVKWYLRWIELRLMLIDFYLKFDMGIFPNCQLVLHREKVFATKNKNRPGHGCYFVGVCAIYLFENCQRAVPVSF